MFCAHAGFESAGSPTGIVRGDLVGSTIRVRFWRVPRTAVPLTESERIDWLYAQWQCMDDWLVGVHPLSG